MRTIDLALIGCGRYGSHYIPAIQGTAGARLAAVCDADPAAAAAAAERSGAPAYSDWRKVLDLPGLGGVVIATPNHLHAPITRAAAERGLHVFCEKPLATTLEDAQASVEACRAADVVLGVGLSSRYEPSFQEARRMLGEGVLGKAEMITSVYHYTLGPAAPGRTWHNDPAMLGGGALTQMGIHSIDRVCWFADAAPVQVYGRVAKGSGRWADNLALVTVAFSNGLSGQIEVAGVASAPRNVLTVHTSKGQIEVSERRLAWYDGDWHEREYEWPAVHAAEVPDFVAAISEGREPLCSGERALPAHAICFGAYRSSAEGRAVSV